MGLNTSVKEHPSEEYLETGEEALSTVAIHQPHLLPWPPYMARFILSDHFVFLNDVDFRKAYYQNRTKFLSANGREKWFALPVGRCTGRLISNTYTNAHPSNLVRLRTACRKLRRFMDITYGKTEHYKNTRDEIFSFLESVADGDWDLSSICCESILFLCRILRVNQPSVHFSSTYVTYGMDRTERILTLVKGTSCNTFLSGWGKGLEVHDIARLHRNNIAVRYICPDDAALLEPTFLTPGVSTLHWILTKGPDHVRERLFEYRRAIRSAGLS